MYKSIVFTILTLLTVILLAVNLFYQIQEMQHYNMLFFK